MRNRVSSALEVLGFLAIAVASFAIDVWLAVIVAGAALILIGYAVGGDSE